MSPAATPRTRPKWPETSKRGGIDLRAIELDVQSEPSINAAVKKIIADSGKIDVLIHNAGHMVFGPAEAFKPEQFAEQYDVNVLGTQRVNRAVLPHMRAAKQGLLVWVSSSSSAGGTPPYLAPYFAAKAAMDSLAVLYARELSRWASRRRSSCQAPSPRAPTTSPIQGDRPTRRGSRSTRSARTTVSAKRC
jgi:NAD(P)-dependent dehydrogenase (short-subunit alcohol dehydrogenase family)